MKKTIHLLPAILMLLAVVFSGCATASKSGAASLQGTWKGQEAGLPGECTLTISGKNLHFKGANPQEWYKGTFVVNEKTNPPQMDYTINECAVPQYIGKTALGFYKLEGSALAMCANEPGNPVRPASFNAPGSRTFTFHK